MIKSSLFTVKPFSALYDSFKKGYSLQLLFKDLIAGITVGIIAIPLSMALAIASGVAPQHGLYTAIIAGSVIAICGGSRFNISGPTAAFVVVLYPVTQQFGLSGLLVATMLSGVLLLIMAFLRLGRIIEYIPMAVTLGFTCGIAIVIATLQLKDLFGLTITQMPENFIEKIITIIYALPSINIADTIVGLVTLIILLQWYRLKTSIPGHLPAVILATILALLFTSLGINVATIGSTFHYTLADGSIGNGIPNILPHFSLPWHILDNDGNFSSLNFSSIKILFPAACSMAALGAIESLLSAVILDNMTSTKHHSNNELMAQGLGNIIAPFFGGITATAAIARSAANVKAGGYSPLAAVFHSLLVLFAVLFFANILSLLPLSAMAALLLVVAWNMSQLPYIFQFIKRANNHDVIVLLICLSLTVLFDMVFAITVGVILACLLFIHTIAGMTKAIEDDKYNTLPNTKVYKITGPLFFAAADKVFGELHDKTTIDDEITYIVLSCENVAVIDAGGMHALVSFVQQKLPKQQIYMCHLQYQPLKMIVKSKDLKEIHQIHFSRNIRNVYKNIKQKL